MTSSGLPDPPRSDDAASVVAAIERAAARLAESGVEDEESSTLTSRVVSHASDARARVRQAVAQAAVHLPEEAFESVIGPLLADANQYVKRAATRSFDEKSRRRKTKRAHDESSADVRALRAKIAHTYTEAAARAAERLADLALAEFVERLNHELLKVAQPLRVGLTGIRDEARRTAGERLAAQTEEQSARLDLLLGIARSARAHARTVVPKFRDEALRPLVEEHVSLLRDRLTGDRSARLRVEIELDPGLAAEIDRGLFGQAVSNLLQNAVESYAPESEEPLFVRVTGERRRADTLVALTVEDRGRGMAPETLARIGEAFVSSKGTGRGLGVANVKRMIETLHGGTVEIESEVGRGTRVTVVVGRRQ